MQEGDVIPEKVQKIFIIMEIEQTQISYVPSWLGFMLMFLAVPFLGLLHSAFSPFKCQSQKLVKHTQTIRRQKSTNCLSVFDHFMGLVFKGLKRGTFSRLSTRCAHKCSSSRVIIHTWELILVICMTKIQGQLPRLISDSRTININNLFKKIIRVRFNFFQNDSWLVLTNL